MFDNTKYSNKPDINEVKKLQNRLQQTEIEINDLANNLAQGCTFKPAYLNGRTSNDFVSQQLFALDFDNNSDIGTELNRCKELNIIPCFGYTTFSHSEEYHKFRLVFCNDEVITNKEDRDKIQKSLIKAFPNCDSQVTDASRLFFGGKTLIFESYDSVINKDLLSNYNNIKEEKKHPNKDNINNINYIRVRKTPSIKSDDINYNIEAIKEQNILYLRSILNITNDTIIFETQQQFFDYIFKIDLSKLLGIDNMKSFKCIFHEDKSPSASIFNDKETGNYIYKCNSNSCGVSYNIIGIIERLGKFKSRPKTYKFIKDLFNIKIMETDWQKEQKEILIENLKAIHNGELEKNCPQTYKNNKGTLRYLEQMHLIALDNVYNDKLTDDSGNVVFFASRSYIANKLDINPNSLSKVSDKLVVLSYHNLLNKLDDEEIPEILLNKSKHINAKDNENNNSNHKRINYFSIPSYTYNKYNDIEEQGVKWKDNHYTMKGVSREMFFRVEGKDVADKLYPQYKTITTKDNKIKDRTTSKASDIRTNEIAIIILNTINEQYYVTEKNIVEILEDKYNKTFVETQIKKSMTEILDGYDLIRVRANKQLKEYFGVSSNGYPFLILKNEDYEKFIEGF